MVSWFGSVWFKFQKNLTIQFGPSRTEPLSICSCKGESSLIFQPSIDIVGRTDQDAMRQTVRCSTSSQKREDDSIEETMVVSDEVDMVNQPESTTRTIGKRLGTHQGCSAEGGAMLPDHVAKSTQSNAGRVENLATTKRSAERRNESRLRLADNSRTIPQILTMMRHKAHSMSAQSLTSTFASDNVWFVNSGASNHMMPHEDWFQEL